MNEINLDVDAGELIDVSKLTEELLNPRTDTINRELV